MKNYIVARLGIRNQRNVELAIREGESVAIMGPIICRKRTLLYLHGGLDLSTSDNVLFDKEHINKMNDKTTSIIRRRRIGFVFRPLV